ncbi:MAG: segregation/condensation protein A [Phycisphaerales bacterium]|nr:segregation/condensation protein A [Phycisphaerales bacterium]
MTEYTVRLDAFEGPMDLLLYLIRRAEVDIHDIPVAVIADQYIEFLARGGMSGGGGGAGERAAGIDIDLAGEFLVMAATLTELKARMLAPPAATAEGEEATEAAGAAKRGAAVDPRRELIEQLLEYKRFRDAAMKLDRRRSEWSHRFPSAGAGVEGEALSAAMDRAAEVEHDLDDLNLTDLLEAFTSVLRTVDLSRVGEHHVMVDDTPIELHAADLLDRIRREGSVEGEEPGLPFARVFAGRTRGEAIGLFLAMLELVRQRKLVVRQDRIHGEIRLELGEEASD